MKKTIGDMIVNYVRKYGEKAEIKTQWGKPLVGFADAGHPDILKLKETIAPIHRLPEEILPGARIVIAYFVPFLWETAYSNRSGDDVASPEWALAYEETNAMFRRMNEFVMSELKNMGYEAAVPPEAYTFNQEKLISGWSQRHLAKAAGMGTFGINNMLITKHGCCGRYGSIVTNLDLEPDQQSGEEYCIFRRNGRCGVCVSRCPSGALTLQGFDREKCHGVLKRNGERYRDFGSSYTDEIGKGANSVGSEVCGKCTTSVPCAFFHAGR